MSVQLSALAAGLLIDTTKLYYSVSVLGGPAAALSNSPAVAPTCDVVSHVDSRPCVSLDDVNMSSQRANHTPSLKQRIIYRR